MQNYKLKGKRLYADVGQKKPVNNEEQKMRKAKIIN